MSISSKMISFGEAKLAPASWIQYAKKYDEDKNEPLADSDELMKTLARVNERVNMITSEIGYDTWRIWPAMANCTDYVATKQSELVKLGYSIHGLLIGEVLTQDNAPHAVLVARVTSGDYVLDNLNPMIYLWNGVGYQWLRVQSPENQYYWHTVQV